MASTVWPPLWFPRRRGDRPGNGRNRWCSGAGSPAGAGIDPSDLPPQNEANWFPRRRGDRPAEMQDGASIWEVPPQARG